MRVKHAWIVFKKEVRDIARDKKTLLSSIVIPMILIPLMNILVGGGAEKFQKDISENVTIALSRGSDTDDVKLLVQNEIIKDRPNIRLVDVDDPDKALKEDKVRVVLDFEKDYAQKLKEGKPVIVKVVFDKSKARSEGSVSILGAAMEEFNQKVVEERIRALGVSPDILEPIRLERSNIAPEQQSGNMMLMMILPMMMGLLMVVGGIPAATDLVAGEKERNTFEPLLTTKPDRTSILIGKYLTVTLFSFASVLATMAGMFIGYIIKPGSLTMGVGDGIGGFYIPPLALGFTILISITQGMTFAGIQIALSTYAKSFKEAQTYLSFLIFAAMIPSYATMFMQPNDIPAYMFLVPILNTISAFKVILGGTINYPYLGIALVSSMVYVVITLALAASLFNKEKVLFRS